MKTTNPATNQFTTTRVLVFIFAALFVSVTASAQVSKPTLRLDSKSEDFKVQLQWSSGDKQNISHFKIERCTNGTEFSDIALIFTGDSGNVYAYTDKIHNTSPTVVYYRLKTVLMDGSYEYSDATAINLHTKAIAIK